jgi:hypothetical protein
MTFGTKWMISYCLLLQNFNGSINSKAIDILMSDQAEFNWLYATQR